MAKKKIDFGGTDKEIRRGGGAKHVPEGDYLLKIVKGEYKTSEKTGGTYINWQFQIADGEHKGSTQYTNTSCKPEALWNLRNLIHAATGKNVAGKQVNFDPDQIAGKVVAATASDDEYDGKMRTRWEDFRPKDELGADEDDSEEEESSDEEEESEEEEGLEEVDIEDL